MNFRIILHLLKTDWRRLRWLIAGVWLLVLLAAWPAVTFSPGHFDNPPVSPIQLYRDGSIESTLVAQGEISPMADWANTTVGWLLTGASLFLAAALGFHTRGWTAGRPVRAREAIAARVAGIAIFLVIPLLAVVPAVSLVHGFGPAASARALLVSAGTHLPRLISACLFGALCGNWLRWIAGVFAFVVTSSMIPQLLGIGSTPFMIPSLLISSGRSIYRNYTQAPLTVVILCCVLVSTSRHMNAWRRIWLAIIGVLLIPSLLPTATIPMAAVPKLPDWSASVEPVLASPELAGTITTEPDYRFSSISRDNDHQPVLQLQFEWKSKGLRSGDFAEWFPTGNGELRSGNELISSRHSDQRVIRSEYGGIDSGLDRQALSAAVASGNEPVKFSAFYDQIANSPLSHDLFGAVEPGLYKTASLDTELSGVAYRYAKLLDIPFGQPAGATVDGVKVHVRRLDLVGSWPVADVCYVNSKPWGTPRLYGLPSYSWIPVIYLPKTGEYHLLDNAYSSEAELATGCMAFRNMYWATERIQGRKSNLEGFESARFLLLKRVDLATMRKSFRSETLPLTINDQQGSPDKRGFQEPPPFQFRPDPATATDRDFDRWLTRSYGTFDSQGWDSRNIADFLPGHLDQILARGGGVHPPSTPEGRAIALACPENRRDEVIAALLRRNSYPDGNWIPDVILRRGWVAQAAPQIREMVAKDAIGENSYSQVMAMSLEDPTTYQAILKQPLWLEVYEQARRLPGIEPALTESLAKQYHEVVKKNDGETRVKMSSLLLPAAHGMNDAFSDLMKAWHSAPPNDVGVFAENLPKVIQIPGNPNNWRNTIAWLAGKEAADFRYDTLARRWVLVSESPR